MGRVVHFEIHASDMDAAERFYTAVFGWTAQRTPSADRDYRLLWAGQAVSATVHTTARHSVVSLACYPVVAAVEELAAAVPASSPRWRTVNAANSRSPGSTSPGSSSVSLTGRLPQRR